MTLSYRTAYIEYKNDHKHTLFCILIQLPSHHSSSLTRVLLQTLAISTLTQLHHRKLSTKKFPAEKKSKRNFNHQSQEFTKMPKSRRAKVIHLSKVEKKGKEHSDKIFTAVRDAADEYPYVYVFRVENMRNNYLKDIRGELSDSRFVSYHL